VIRPRASARTSGTPGDRGTVTVGAADSAGTAEAAGAGACVAARAAGWRDGAQQLVASRRAATVREFIARRLCSYKVEANRWAVKGVGRDEWRG